MSMLTTLLGNLCRPSRTRAPADLPPVPPAFRGALAHDPARCTACGTCAVVCAPNAIRFAAAPPHSVTWLFQIGRCSFCGLCMQNCPTQAIAMDAAPPRAFAGTATELASVVRYTPCPRCGRPHIPLPDAASAECPTCRQWTAAAGLRRAFVTNGEAKHGP